MTQSKIFYNSPQNVDSFLKVNQELDKISKAFAAISNHVVTEVTRKVPEKAIELGLYYADGTDWNPGSGEGLYIYINNAYQKITKIK